MGLWGPIIRPHASLISNQFSWKVLHCHGLMWQPGRQNPWVCWKKCHPPKSQKSKCLVIQSDLFGMVKWPFEGVKWPPTRGWISVTAWITWWFTFILWNPFLQWCFKTTPRLFNRNHTVCPPQDKSSGFVVETTEQLKWVFVGDRFLTTRWAHMGPIYQLEMVKWGLDKWLKKNG